MTEMEREGRGNYGLSLPASMAAWSRSSIRATGMPHCMMRVTASTAACSVPGRARQQSVNVCVREPGSGGRSCVRQRGAVMCEGARQALEAPLGSACSMRSGRSTSAASAAKVLGHHSSCSAACRLGAFAEGRARPVSPPTPTPHPAPTTHTHTTQHDPPTHPPTVHPPACSQRCMLLRTPPQAGPTAAATPQ